jgi:drug/metabolite transporter (DMT)-like permease
MSEQKIKTSFSGVIILLLTAFIWGTSFLAQSAGSAFVEPFTFMGLRTLTGSLFLIPVILIKDRITGRSMTEEQLAERRKSDRKLLVSGTLMGIALCTASNLQQFAFTYPDHSAGKIAFITAMYMFMVPLIGLFFRKKVPLLTWLCVAVGFTGLYFLCIDSRGLGSVTGGDILSLCCAVCYAVQILMIERFAPGADGIKLSCVQFFVSGAISFILMLIFENPQWTNIRQAAFPLLYSGIGSCGIAYTLQILGQQRCEATIASLLMCMESVFAVLTEAAFAAWFAFGSKLLTAREVSGCILMFAAIVISQLAQLKKNG